MQYLTGQPDDANNCTSRFACRYLQAPLKVGLKIRIVVTGSKGFIGERVARKLRMRGCDVVAFDVRDSSNICDLQCLVPALAGADGVIHLAAISRVAWGEHRPGLCRRVNVDGTVTLVRAMLALNQKPWLVFASSREVYGNATVLPVTEDVPICPVNIYGSSKAAAEHIISSATNNDSLRTAIIRLSSVYGGANDHHDRVIPALLCAALNNKDLMITGAANRFDFVHVDDSVDGLLRAAKLLTAGAQFVPTVHLATGVGTSLDNLARTVVRIARSNSNIRIEPPRSFDAGGFIGDPSRAKRVLSWTAKISLEQGLTELCKQMREGRAPTQSAVLPELDKLL